MQKGRHAGPSWQHAAEHHLSAPPHPLHSTRDRRAVSGVRYTLCSACLCSRVGGFLTELSHTHTCRRRNCFVVLYSTCIVMHRNVDLLTGGDSDWPRRGVREFATPGRNRKREQHVGGHKREGDEEESSPCTGPCKTTTSVRSVPLLQYNTTRRVGM